MLVDDDRKHVAIPNIRHSFVATPFEDVEMAERVSWLLIRVRRSERRARGSPPAAPQRVRVAALCNSSMSVITQMLQRVVTMAQTAMAVVDNHRDVARTRFITAPHRRICSEFSPQSRSVRC
jgi:hypothetical protein